MLTGKAHTPKHALHRLSGSWYTGPHRSHTLSLNTIPPTTLCLVCWHLSAGTPTSGHPPAQNPDCTQPQNPGQALEPLAFAKALASITHVLDSFAAIPVTVPAMGYSQSTESRPKKASLPSCSAMEEGESQPAGSTSLNPTRVTAEEEGSSNSTR